MNIYNAIAQLKEKIPCIDKHISLWKVEQAIDNNKSFIVPSYPFYGLYNKHIASKGLGDTQILGLPYHNFDLIHSFFIWSMNPKTVVISDRTLEFIYKSSLIDYVSSELFFAFPSQAILVQQVFKGYSGILFCKDCIDDGLSKEYSLNISLLSNNHQGKYLSFSLPTGSQVNPFQDLRQTTDWVEVSFAFYVLLYVLNEYLHKGDIITQNGIDYMGFGFEQKIEQHRFQKGVWRNAHWHTYKEKMPNGSERQLIKWIQPIWVSN